MRRLLQGLSFFCILIPCGWGWAEDSLDQHDAALERLLFSKSLTDPHRRNQRLLEWIEQHRHEFGSVDPARGGWGELGTEIVGWILASGLPEDSWAAVRLYAELNHSALPTFKTPAFGSREGRDFLLQIVLSNKVLTSERARALQLLGKNSTPRKEDSTRPPPSPVTDAEVADLLDKLLPLLEEKDESFRAAAVWATHQLAYQTSREADKQRTLEALIKAYQAEKPGSVRDDLAEAVCLLGGAQRWQQLTGNPAGIRVFIRDLARQGQQVTFWLGMPAGQMTVTECPTLILERLNPGGLFADKITKPLPTTYLPRPWNEGWEGGVYLPVQFSVEGLAAGTWRVGVEGTGKKEDMVLKWTAEPKTFFVEAVKKPNSGGGLLDKIKGIFEMKK
jgi:hypothetical protein